ncbi:uncharacterized protein LOC129774078 [Toxorhynchites rutilus septentrionalis]|uniref:uncharacterized protein LOC129774078 n=1 Tax=Toxorhynchites rutilus septentrionalis TaxID=329112 RepID=UPI00247B200D|nr:uncharacterized protein LOC129774078 [Toxorhynchites rutilus septentrionalis]
MTNQEVVCKGFCKANFHFNCAKISEALYKEVDNQPGLFWMCKGCRDVMANARSRNAMVSINAAAKEVKDVYQKLVDDLKTDIKESLIAELKQEIQGGFNKLTPAVSSPLPRHFNFNFGNRSTPKRGRDEDILPSQEQPTKIFHGTGQSVNNTLLRSGSRADDKFWVYLSKISPDVKEADVQQLVKERLSTDDVIAKPLVPKGRPLSTLTFVSFKIGVSQDLKAKAMDPSTWPREIEFREFLEYGTNVQHFWKPPQVIDTGTSATNQSQQLPIQGGSQ